MKKTQLRRLLALIPFLENNPGVSCDEVARRLGGSSEEVVDTLNKILMCGSPPYLPDDYIGFSVERGGIHLRFSSHFACPIRLTLEEALSAVVLLREVGVYAEGAFAEAAASLRAKVSEAIRSVTGHDVGAVADRVTCSRGSAVPAEMVAQIETAVVERREVDMSYYSVHSDRTTLRRVRPYGIVESIGDLYLVAHCCDRGAVLTFRVDRIHSLEVRHEIFEEAAEFDLERYRSETFYFPASGETEVRIRFTGEAADSARESLRGQALSEIGDGVLLTIRSGSPEWVKRFCLKFGSEAEIEGPPGMRKEMVATLRRIRDLYR